MYTLTPTIVGNLTADPELKYVGKGTPVANFTVAYTPREKNRDTGEWEDGETLFVDCAVWRDMAENVTETLTRGMAVIVTGALKVHRYQRTDGTTGERLAMDVEAVGPNLHRATAVVSKRPHNGANAGQVGNPTGGRVQTRTAGAQDAQTHVSDPWATPPAF